MGTETMDERSGQTLGMGTEERTDQSMAVYVSALRHDRRTGRLRDVYWVPTDWMLANAGTKLEEDGTIPLGELPKTMITGVFKINEKYVFSVKQMIS